MCMNYKYFCATTYEIEFQINSVAIIFFPFSLLLQPYELPICHFDGTAYGGSVLYKSKQKLTNPVTKEITEVYIIIDII